MALQHLDTQTSNGATLKHWSLAPVEFQRILETFVEVSAEIVSITDADLDHPEGPRMQYINPAGLIAAGYGVGEFVGKRLSGLYNTEALGPMIALLRDALVSGKAVSVEFPARNRAGNPFWVEIRAIPVPNAEGRVTHFIRIGRDVSARKNAEIQRENTQRLLASIFGVMDQALCVVDEAGDVALANAAFTRHFGWSVAELMGKPWAEAIAEDDRARVQREMISSLARSSRIEARLRHKDGTLRPGTIVSTVLRQPGDRLYYVLTLTADSAAVAAQTPAITLSTVSRAMRETVFHANGRRASFCLLRLPGPLQQKLEQSRGMVIDDNGMAIDTDCLMLNLAAEEAAKDEAVNIRSSFGIPVDYSLFDSRERIGGFLKLCDGLSPSQRRRLVVILQHVPAHTHRDRIADIVQMLKPYTRHVGFAHTELGGSHISGSGRHNATLVTIPATRILGRLTPDRLENMVSQIHLAGAKVLVHHVPPGADRALLREAGIDLLCGDGVV